MPLMDGKEATKAIRAYEKRNMIKPTPIIALTAHVMAEQRNLFIELGMNDHLAKPITQKEVNDMLVKWTEKTSNANVA